MGNNIISFADRLKLKKDEDEDLNSYIAQNSIVLSHRDDLSFEIAVILDFNGDESIKIDDVIPAKQKLLNICIGSMEDEDEDAPFIELHYKPRFGDLLNHTARYLEEIGYRRCVCFVYDVKQMDDPETGNTFLIYYVITTDEDE